MRMCYTLRRDLPASYQRGWVANTHTPIGRSKFHILNTYIYGVHIARNEGKWAVDCESVLWEISSEYIKYIYIKKNRRNKNDENMLELYSNKCMGQIQSRIKKKPC